MEKRKVKIPPTELGQDIRAFMRELIKEAVLSEKETLRTWFGRRGAPGKKGGWVDCNTCRKGKCKPCGRSSGEKRSKYPSCRPMLCRSKSKFCFF